MSDQPCTSSAVPYLHLLKHALAFTLWPEPLLPVTGSSYPRGFKRLVVALLTRLLGLAGFVLARRSTVTDRERRGAR